MFALAFLAAHRRELFPGQMFADLFKTGGWLIPAEVIASVIVLQSGTDSRRRRGMIKHKARVRRNGPGSVGAVSR